MNIKFIKLHSSGTDVIVIDGMSLDPGLLDIPSLARAILRRRRGAGADALAIIDPPDMENQRASRASSAKTKPASAYVRAYLPSGEPALADSDAMLCASRFLFDSGRVIGERFEVMSPSGKRRIEVMTSSDFTICLGKPRPSGSEAEGSSLAEAMPFTVLEAGGRRVSVCALDLGRTYLALLTQDGSSGRLEELERASGVDPRGPSAPRAIIVRPIARDTLRIKHSAARGWDGASAAGAALVAAVAAGSADREAAVLSGGGVRYAEWSHRDGKVSVTAPVEYVYEGEWYMPDGTEAETEPASPSEADQA